MRILLCLIVTITLLANTGCIFRGHGGGDGDRDHHDMGDRGGDHDDHGADHTDHGDQGYHGDQH